MKKPTLADYDLTEDLIIKSKKQQILFKQEMQDYIENQHKKHQQTSIFLFSIAGIMLFALILSSIIAEKINLSFALLFFIYLFSIVIYLFIYDQYHSSSNPIKDIDDKIRKQIGCNIIDFELESRVNKYYEAVKEYQYQKSIVDNQSIVYTKISTYNPFEKDYIFTGNYWIVFSNKYVTNAEDYPDLGDPSINYDSYRQRYNAISYHHQINEIKPIPKLDFNISQSDGFLYFYPGTNAHLALYKKRKGDVSITRDPPFPPQKFEILDIINPDD